jgi:uncharacterized repeat protein (TIGR01451 family)
MRVRLAVALALVAAAALAVAVASPGVPRRSSAFATTACGVERWAVKTLTDRRARLVKFTPRRTTVRALRRLRAPAAVAIRPRIRGVETTTYQVRAALVEMKLEDDSDVHLVIAEPGDPTLTMIVEFPSSGCTRRASAKAKRKMRAARSALIRACGPASDSFKRLTGSATISGVGFFDVLHGQRGVAPNGIELHPVLSFTRARCRSGAPPPPANADLALTKADSPDPVAVGGRLTYTIAVSNTGPSRAQAVTVADSLPPSTTLVGATITQGSCSGTTTITCTVPSLERGAAATITIAVTPTAGGPLSNTASVSASTPDPNGANNTATTTTTVTGAPPPPPPANCAPSYPDVCIPPPPPDLDCNDIPYRNFRVIYTVPDPDPHRFDSDRDGIGCET